MAELVSTGDSYLKRKDDNLAIHGTLDTWIAVGFEARIGRKRDLLFPRVLQ
jgi:hypothetical protein